MEQLTIFDYSGVSIRVFGMKHNPWFVGLDVAQALGYKYPTDALRRYVDMEDRTSASALVLINEYGLYSLIANSGNKAAKRYFTECALPQIHKSGKCKAKTETESRKKYVRLYELASGEKLSKADLGQKARLLGMTKSNANYASVPKLIEYIEYHEKKIAETKRLEKVKDEYPYSYDEAEEISQYNLPSIMHKLPESSYKCVGGVYRFNNIAIETIKHELSRWK